jgi:PAS domain S-box-containing protein
VTPRSHIAVPQIGARNSKQTIRLKVVEASPDAMIAINRLRKVVDCNEEAEHLFGYARRHTRKTNRPSFV